MNNPNAPTTSAHVDRFESELAESTARSTHGTEEPATAEREEEMLRTTDPVDMVRQVTRRVGIVTGLLEETRGFNNNTGKPELVIPEGHPRRRALEVELHQLNTYTLPATKAKAADIAARKAALPTVDDRMRAEVARQQRIQQAAVKRAEELEVEAAAQRLLAQRRVSGGVG